MDGFDWVPWLAGALITLCVLAAADVVFIVWAFAAAAHLADSTDDEEEDSNG